MRWVLGGVLIEHNVSLVGKAASRLIIWPSWSDWASVYGRCRDDFLAHYRVRHPYGTPGAELLYRAHLADGDGGAEAVATELRQQDSENDPRLRLRGTARR